MINYLETAISANMDLDIDERAIVLAPLESVTRVPMLLVIAIGGSTVREKDHDLMDRLWVLREVVLKST